MKGTAPAMDVEGAVEGSRRLSVGSNVRKQQLQLMKRPADQLFVEYDFDQNGALDEDEFCKLMTALGMRSQCEKLFVTADIDKSGTLELPEFRKLVHELRTFQANAAAEETHKVKEKEQAAAEKEKEMHAKESVRA